MRSAGHKARLLRVRLSTKQSSIGCTATNTMTSHHRQLSVGRRGHLVNENLTPGPLSSSFSVPTGNRSKSSALLGGPTSTSGTALSPVAPSMHGLTGLSEEKANCVRISGRTEDQMQSECSEIVRVTARVTGRQTHNTAIDS